MRSLNCKSAQRNPSQTNKFAGTTSPNAYTPQQLPPTSQAIKRPRRGPSL
jgi:hypothetical protein